MTSKTPNSKYWALASAIGAASMWCSLMSLPSGTLEVDRAGRLNLFLLAMQAAEWPCAESVLSNLDYHVFYVLLIVFGAVWMNAWAAIASRLASRSRPLGALVIILAAFALLPLWPTSHFMCPSI